MPSIACEAHRFVIDSGRTIAEVATELGLGAQLLGKWVSGDNAAMESLFALLQKNVSIRFSGGHRYRG